MHASMTLSDRTANRTIALLNPPSMINRNGSPFNIDSMNRNVLLQAAKIHGIGLNTPAMAQFPPQRIQAPIPGPRIGGACGVQLPLNMLCDVVAKESIGAKRKSLDGPSSAKRQKFVPSGPAIKLDNPMLLERLIAMGGGFPMPKWGGIITKPNPKPQPPKQLSANSGSFPMPPLKDGNEFNPTPKLATFKNLWSNTDLDLRREVLSKKLQGRHQ